MGTLTARQVARLRAMVRDDYPLDREADRLALAALLKRWDAAQIRVDDRVPERVAQRVKPVKSG